MISNFCCTVMLHDTGGGSGGLPPPCFWISVFISYFIIFPVWKELRVKNTVFNFFMQRVMNAEWCLYFYGRVCDLKIHV